MMSGLIPLPNNGPVSYISAPSLPNDWRQENIRIDHNIASATRIFGRYTQEEHNYVYTNGNYDSAMSRTDFPTKSGVINFNHSFTPSLLNEFVASFASVHLNYDAIATSSSPGLPFTNRHTGLRRRSLPRTPTMLKRRSYLF